MAIRFIEGFDAYNSQEEAREAGWAEWGSAFTPFVTGRSGSGQALRITDNNSFTAHSIQNIASHEVYIGFAWLNNNIPSTVGHMIQVYQRSLYDSSNWHSEYVAVVCNASGILSLQFLGSTVASSTQQLSSDNWYYIEVYCYAHDTLGKLELRVNGEVWASYEGDTYYYYGYVATIRFEGSDGDVDIDDIYVLDGTGSAPYNTYLGDCNIATIYPTVDDTSAWSQSTVATDNADLVDADTPVDTEYVYSSTLNQEDLYEFDTTPTNVGTVYGVQVTARISKDETGDRAIAMRSSSGANEQTGSNEYPNADFQARHAMFQTSDSGGTTAWTKALIDAASFGIKLTV